MTCKGVTMRAIFSDPAGWKFIDSNGWKKSKFWRKHGNMVKHVKKCYKYAIST